MITEAQRRALFALREALWLMETQGINLWPTGTVDYHLNPELGGGTIRMTYEDLDAFLAEHPES